MLIYDFFQILKNDHLSFLYKGIFSDSITNEIVNLSETNINQNKEELSSLKKKVPFLMVESFQNIVRHGDKYKNDTGFFMSRNISHHYFITSGNGIENENAASLRSKLEMVNALNKDELKDYYLEIINNNEISKKGGAGLGLIEMARKSGQKLDFGFYPMNDEYSIFYLQINLNNNELTEKELSTDIISVNVATEFHRKMRDNNILMVYQGDFSHETIFPIISMIENNLSHDENEVKKNRAIFHILVELLQNIMKHANITSFAKKGIFAISERNNSYQVSAGNYILTDEIEPLKQQLTFLNSLNKNDLKELYKKVIREGVESDDGGAGLGLIDLARESSAPMDFDFYQGNDNLVFFELTVNI